MTNHAQGLQRRTQRPKRRWKKHCLPKPSKQSGPSNGKRGVLFPPSPTKDGIEVQGRTTVRDTTPAGVATKHSERKKTPSRPPPGGLFNFYISTQKYSRPQEHTPIVQPAKTPTSPTIPHIELRLITKPTQRHREHLQRHIPLLPLIIKRLLI